MVSNMRSPPAARLMPNPCPLTSADQAKRMGRADAGADRNFERRTHGARCRASRALASMRMWISASARKIGQSDSGGEVGDAERLRGAQPDRARVGRGGHRFRPGGAPGHLDISRVWQARPDDGGAAADLADLDAADLMIIDQMRRHLRLGLRRRALDEGSHAVGQFLERAWKFERARQMAKNFERNVERVHGQKTLGVRKRARRRLRSIAHH